MQIDFNNIPTTIRTPGNYNEIDNTRALKGLVANPHKALLIGQKSSAGSVTVETLVQVTNEGLIDGFFGAGSELARMAHKFKEVNPNTELYAVAISVSAAAVAASGDINVTGSATADGTVFQLVGGTKVYTPVTSGWSGTDIVSAMKSDINAISALGLRGSNIAASTDRLIMVAKNSGELGNYRDFRINYYEGQSNPPGVVFSVTAMAGGANNPDLGAVWAVIADEQFHHIVNPYTDSANFTEIEDELDSRFGPLIAMQGHAYQSFRGSQSSSSSLGNGRNSPHGSILAMYNSPTDPDIIATCLAAVCAPLLQDDPARPVQLVELPGVLPPPSGDRFTRAERDVLLYDGISTYVVDSSGRVLVERVITTYQKTSLGTPDPSYLDIETMFTLMEIRYQWNVRMVLRYISQRFKLADDTFPVQPGQKIATPRTIKQETISLFTLLRDRGLIENLDDFIKNLVVARNTTDVNRVDALLAPDLVNQFRILAGRIEFIL